MYVNPNIIVAAVGAIVLYALGLLLARRLARRWVRGVVGGALALGCLPGVMLIAYYLHIFGEPLWYVEWRSVPHVEVLSALGAPFFGFVGGRRAFLFPAARGLLRLRVAALCALFVFAPYAKPVVLPVAVAARWADEWRDGVCLQSSPSTCGPASLATFLAHYGVTRSEREIARASYSCAGGTELWYLMRYARRQGVPVACRHEPRLARIRTPAVLGARVTSYGHFIVLLAYADGQVTIGDPQIGRLTLSEEDFRRRYQFGGCVLNVGR